MNKRLRKPKPNSLRVSKTPEQWWATSIIEMRPGVIRYRGYAIEDLIGQVGFAEMVWLLTRGELPSSGQADLLEAALVAVARLVAGQAFALGKGAKRRNGIVLRSHDDEHGPRLRPRKRADEGL